MLPRHVRPIVETALDESQVVAVAGARQTGKTTLARAIDGLAKRLGTRFANGVLLYHGREVVALGPGRTAMPLSALWAE